MMMSLDRKQARSVFASRGTDPLEMRVALLFKVPKDSERLVAEEFAEVLDDGLTGRETIRQILQRLTTEKVLTPVTVSSAGVDDARFASETCSLAWLLQGIAGDLAAMGSWASEHVRVDGVDPGTFLAKLRTNMTQLQHALTQAQKAFISEQLEPTEYAQHGDLQLNLGCGAYRIPGWTNIDFAPGALRLNLSWDLPFADDSARLVYSAHTFEHLDFHTAAPRLAKEVYRVLAPRGTIRLAVPNIAAYVSEYAAGNDAFFSAYDRQRPEFGGLAGYSTNLSKVMLMAGSAVRPGWFFEHKMGYDFETLAMVLRKAGFTTIERLAYGVSAHPTLGSMDENSEAAGFIYEGVANTLFVEATK